MAHRLSPDLKALAVSYADRQSFTDTTRSMFGALMYLKASFRTHLRLWRRFVIHERRVFMFDCPVACAIFTGLCVLISCKAISDATVFRVCRHLLPLTSDLRVFVARLFAAHGRHRLLRKFAHWLSGEWDGYRVVRDAAEHLQHASLRVLQKIVPETRHCDEFGDLAHYSDAMFDGFVFGGHAKEVKEFMEKRSYPVDSGPAMWAASAGHEELAMWLLDQYAEVCVEQPLLLVRPAMEGGHAALANKWIKLSRWEDTRWNHPCIAGKIGQGGSIPLAKQHVQIAGRAHVDFMLICAAHHGHRKLALWCRKRSANEMSLHGVHFTDEGCANMWRILVSWGEKWKSMFCDPNSAYHCLAFKWTSEYDIKFEEQRLHALRFLLEVIGVPRVALLAAKKQWTALGICVEYMRELDRALGDSTG